LSAVPELLQENGNDHHDESVGLEAEAHVLADLDQGDDGEEIQDGHRQNQDGDFAVAAAGPKRWAQAKGQQAYQDERKCEDSAHAEAANSERDHSVAGGRGTN
jgi:hypothetical protein